MDENQAFPEQEVHSERRSNPICTNPNMTLNWFGNKWMISQKKSNNFGRKVDENQASPEHRGSLRELGSNMPKSQYDPKFRLW